MTEFEVTRIPTRWMHSNQGIIGWLKGKVNKGERSVKNVCPSIMADKRTPVMPQCNNAAQITTQDLNLRITPTAATMRLSQRERALYQRIGRDITSASQLSEEEIMSLVDEGKIGNEDASLMLHRLGLPPLVPQSQFDDLLAAISDEGINGELDWNDAEFHHQPSITPPVLRRQTKSDQQNQNTQQDLFESSQEEVFSPLESDTGMGQVPSTSLLCIEGGGPSMEASPEMRVMRSCASVLSATTTITATTTTTTTTATAVTYATSTGAGTSTTTTTSVSAAATRQPGIEVTKSTAGGSASPSTPGALMLRMTQVRKKATHRSHS